MPTKQKVSVEEYLALPEEKPYLEYIDGEVIPKPMPDLRHMILIDEAEGNLWLYKKENGGVGGPEGRIEFQLPVDTQFRLPDLSYWAPGRPVRGNRAMQPPTLAVEARSPDQTMAQQRERCHFFRANGVDVCWLIDPDSETVEVFEDETAGLVMRPGDVLRSTYLPGCELSVASLFEALDR